MISLIMLGSVINYLYLTRSTLRDSCGIWVPCLSYADGLFWLIYTDVKRYAARLRRARHAHRFATRTTTS